MYDHLIVGAGFAGIVCAERLARAGRRVRLIDKRPHIGGNAHDRLDAAGVLIHPRDGSRSRSPQVPQYVR